METVYLGLGTNLGDRLAMLRATLGEIAALGTLFAVSSVYETEPWGDSDQPRFLNLCCALRTDLAPEALHAKLKDLEQRLGRRQTRRWGPRVIDIDLLTYGGRTVATERLTIPHPRIAQRAFVLAPLAEIAPALRIPGLDSTVSDLLAQIPEHGSLAWVVAPPSAVLPVRAGESPSDG